MNYKFSCVYCRNEIVVLNIKTGEVVRCRNCGQYNVVPSDAAETDGNFDSVNSPAVVTESPVPYKGAFGPSNILDVLGRSFLIYGKCMVQLFLVSLIFQIPFFIIQYSFYRKLINNLDYFIRFPENLTTPHIIYSFSGLILSIISFPFIMGSSVYIVSKYEAGQKKSVFAAIRVTISKTPAILGAFALTALVVGLTAITIIGFPLAIYIGLSWSLASMIITIEGKNIVMALGRSYILLNGHRWRIFSVIFTFLIIGGVLSSLGGLVFIDGTPLMIYQMIINIFIIPLNFVMLTVLYLDLRARKEGYNKEMLRKDLEALDIAEGETPAPPGNREMAK